MEGAQAMKEQTQPHRISIGVTKSMSVSVSALKPYLNPLSQDAAVLTQYL